MSKEWRDESGYCNCLLVVMSRVRISEVEICSDKRLPELVSMSKPRPNTETWIREQEIDIEKLSPSVIIEILVDSATMGSLPWTKSTGSIDIVDCVEDDGPTVNRVFNLKLSKRKSAKCLRISQEIA